VHNIMNYAMQAMQMQCKVGQGGARVDRAGQGGIGQCRAGQGMAGRAVQDGFRIVFCSPLLSPVTFTTKTTLTKCCCVISSKQK